LGSRSGRQDLPEREDKAMSRIADVVKLKSGYANFVELKSAFGAAQKNADRMASHFINHPRL